jgi:Protein of unknown function (DUF2877)
MPMEVSMFKVLSIGYLVRRVLQEAGSFEMHSQFRHALNLKSAGGSLLTLLGPDTENFPTAIRLNLPLDWDWRGARFDHPVFYESGTLSGNAWSADLQDAVRWRPEVADVKDVEGASLQLYHAALTESLRAYVGQHRITSGLQLLPGESTRARIPKLAFDADLRSVDAGVSALVGYGGGLTPDGDDYLLGYMAVLWPWRDTPSVASHLDLVRQSVGRYLHGTTDISRHYLALALDGHFSEPVNRLVFALTAGQPMAETVRLARDVMRFGAASGVDTVAGMLHGIRTLQDAVKRS